MQRNYLPLAGLLLAFLAVTPIHAGIIAYGDPTDVGNQQWTGALGENFDVNSAIVVSELGIYDSGQDGILGTLTVAIFDQSGSQDTPTLTFTGTDGTLSGGDRFLTLTTPITLLPGVYSLATAGWGSGADLDGNGNIGGTFTPPALNTGGGLISFTGIGWSAGGLSYLAPVSPYPADEFDAGSFMFTAATTQTPEPATFAGVTLGLLALAGIRRKLSQR